MYTAISENVRVAIDRANRLAAEAEREHLGTVHLLFAVLVDDVGMSARVLTNLGVDVSALRADIDQCLHAVTDKAARDSLPGSKRVIDTAFALADDMQHACVVW